MGGANSTDFFHDVWSFQPAGSSLQNPVHSYTSVGNYSVALQAYNSDGYNSTRRIAYINVTPVQSPVASFTTNVSSGTSPLTVQFTDTSTNTPTSWNWSFRNVTGNNTQIFWSTTQNATQTFGVGNFLISLNATNSAGFNTSTQITFINVTTANNLPVATNVMLTSSSGFNRTSDNLTLSWSVSDIDGNPVRNITNWYRNGTSIMRLNMPFEGGSNATFTKDYSGFGNNGAVNGSVWNATGGYDGGGAYNFTGSQYISVPDSTSLDIDGTEISLEAWIYPTAFADYMAIAGKEANASAEPYWVYQLEGTASGVSFRLSTNGTARTWVDSSALTTNQWYHVVGTYNGTYINLYINGELNNTVAKIGNITSSTGNFSIGRFQNGNKDNFRGRIDNVRVYSRALSPEQIKALYQNRSDLIVSQELRAGDIWQGAITPNDGIGDGVAVFSNFLNVTSSPAAPVASFTANRTWGNAPVAVQFTDTSTNSPTAWNWSFGDSTFSNLQNPNHTFSTPGIYTINLTVSNTGGSNLSVRQNYLTVTVPHPATAFSANATLGNAPLAVQFTDSSTNTPTGWAWYFGDEKYNQSWTLLNASAGWPARYSHSTAVLPDGSILLTGGMDSGYNRLNDTWRSTDNGATWTLMNASSGWAQRDIHSSVALPDGSVIIMGGSAAGGLMNDVWRSTDFGVTWSRVNASAGWDPRDFHSSTVMPDGSIILTGGYDGSLSRNDVWRSADNGFTWMQMNASAEWQERSGHSTVTMPDGSIVLMGGSVRNDTWRSTDFGVTWAEMNASAGWPARYRQGSAVLPDGSIILMGGEVAASTYVNDVWRSADNGGTWGRINVSASWTARDLTGGLALAMPDGSITLIGGYDGGFKNDTWRFQPDGSSLQNPVHTYTSAGNYSVALQTYNAGGWNSTQKTLYINVTSPSAPVTSFTSNITWSYTPLTVQFNDTSTNSPTAWNWSFGDSTFSDLQNPIHTYSIQGTYTVNLTASNAGGSNLSTKRDLITAAPLKPVIRFSANATSGTVPFTVSFTDSSTNSPTGWAWFFGDEPYNRSWVQVTSAANWTARQGHTSVILPDGSIVMAGGATGTSAGDGKNDVWRSTDSGATWTQMTGGASWAARQWHSSVALPDGSILIMGGYGTDYSSKNDVWRSTDNGATWTQMTGSASWNGRYGHGSVVMPNGTIILLGGSGSNGVWKSTDNGASWSLVTSSASWMPRTFFGVVLMPDNSIVLMGGYSSGYKNDVWRSTDSGATWTQMNTSPGWDAREYLSSVALPDGTILLTGGESSGNPMKDVWRSKDYGTTWTKDPDPSWSGRYHHSTTLLRNGSVLLTGGQITGCLHDVWLFSPAGSESQNPVHTYTSSGNYSVALQAYNTGGFNSTQTTAYITVTPVSPVASFTSNVTSGIAPLTVQFNDTSTNTPTSWYWDFGDGTPISTLQNPLHAFSFAGTYQVYLNVTNSGGSSQESHPVFVDFAKVAMFRGNRSHTGLFDDNGIRPTANLKWKIATGAAVGSSPVITNGTLYIGSNDGKLYAVNASNGGPVWNISIGGSNIESTPAVADDIVYIGSWDKNVYARNAMTGGSVWAYTTGDYITSSPAVKNGIVYIGSNDGKVYALNATSGVPVWTFDTLSTVGSSPAVANDIVYVGSGTSAMNALNATTGSVVWRNTSLAGQVISSPAVANGTVYFGSYNNKVYAVNAATGSPRWEFTTSGNVDSSPAVSGDVIYIGCDDKNFYALGATNGTELWNFVTGDVIKSSPAVANGRVYIGSSDTSLYALDSITGAEIFRYTSGGSIRSSPWVDNGTVFFGNENGEVFALGGSGSVPVASFAANVTSGTAPLAVQFNDTSTNTPTAWNWSFRNVTGNNTQIFWSTYRNATQTFGAGNFSIALNATNSAGFNASTQVTFINVTTGVTAPVASFTSNNSWGGKSPVTIRFNDTSTNIPTSWNWSFGDGTFSVVQNATHTFTSLGMFNVSLTAANAGGSNKTMEYNYTHVSDVTANFTWTCNATVRYRVDFQDTSTSSFPPLESHSWNFGDGNSTAMTGTPSNVFPNASIAYPVQLTVWDSLGGGGVDNKTVINVTPCSVTAAPVASFTANVTSGTAPLVVAFTDTSTNSPTGWYWAFRNVSGNNTQVWWSTGQNPTHTFGTGKYAILLNASNSLGYNFSTQITFVNVTTAVPPANATTINQSATLFIGEEGLNLTHALNQAAGATDINGIPTLTTIGWWSSPSSVGVAAPTVTVALSTRYRSMLIDPDTFVGRTGYWYLLDSGLNPITPAIFTITDPSLDIKIWDLDHATDVTGTSISQGTRLRFRIDTNMHQMVNNRSPLNPATDGFIDISVKNATGTAFNTLYNDSTSAGIARAGPHTILANYVNTQPFYWGASPGYSWATGALNGSSPLYPPGTYTVIAASTLHNMRDNYRDGGADYTGKTVSLARTVTLASQPAPAVSFTADATNGTVPFAVHFTDTSDGSPVAWNWSFGDGNYSTVQNPAYTFVLPKVHNVTLTATFSSILSNSTMQQITGYATKVSTTSTVNGTTSTTVNGNQTMIVNTTAIADTGGNVTTTDTTITITGGNAFWQNTQIYAVNVAVNETTGNFTVTNVTQVVMQSAPITTSLNETFSNVSVSLDIALKQYIPDADVNITITQGATSDTSSAFQRAAQNASMSVSDIAYTVQFTNTELINTNLTNNASRSTNAVVLNMSVNHTWVSRFNTGTNNDGRGSIAIIRYPESGNPKVLTTRFVVYNESENLDWFEADSPNGLSIFGMVGYAAQQAASSQQGSGVSSGIVANQEVQENQNPEQQKNDKNTKTTPKINPSPNNQAPVVTIPAYMTTAPLKTDKASQIIAQVQVKSIDQAALLTLPQGTQATDVSGQTLTSVSIQQLDNVAPPESSTYTFSGLAYQCGPDGAQFSPPISITFRPTETQWNSLNAEGTAPVVRSYSTTTGTWQSLPTTTDPAAKSISAQVTHFSDFAVFSEPATVQGILPSATQPMPTDTPKNAAKPPSNALEIMINLATWCLDFITKNIISAIIVIVLIVLSYAGWMRYRRKRQHDFIMYGRR